MEIAAAGIYNDICLPYLPGWENLTAGCPSSVQELQRLVETGGDS